MLHQLCVVAVQAASDASYFNILIAGLNFNNSLISQAILTLCLHALKLKAERPGGTARLAQYSWATLFCKGLERLRSLHSAHKELDDI